MLTAALDYAGRGWSVFPAPPGAKKSHKRAAHSGGRRWGATRDPAEIMRDFTRWPNANIGLPCGPDSGFWVSEIDTKARHGVDGFAALVELIAEHGPLPATLMAESPSGSRHYYWSWPLEFPITNSTSKIGPGIDVRGQGGMVIAPPSVREEGLYRWLNDLPIARAPQWLLELAVRNLDVQNPNSAPAFLAGEKTGAGVSTNPDDNHAPPTIEKVAAALAVLDPDCDYTTWMRIGAACKDFPDQFVEWSARSDKYPGEAECYERAAEFATLSQITIATLFHLANECDPAWRLKLPPEPVEKVNLDDF